MNGEGGQGEGSGRGVILFPLSYSHSPLSASFVPESHTSPTNRLEFSFSRLLFVPFCSCVRWFADLLFPLTPSLSLLPFLVLPHASSFSPRSFSPFYSTISSLFYPFLFRPFPKSKAQHTCTIRGIQRGAFATVALAVGTWMCLQFCRRMEGNGIGLVLASFFFLPLIFVFFLFFVELPLTLFYFASPFLSDVIEGKETENACRKE